MRIERKHLWWLALPCAALVFMLTGGFARLGFGRITMDVPGKGEVRLTLEESRKYLELQSALEEAGVKLPLFYPQGDEEYRAVIVWTYNNAGYGGQTMEKVRQKMVIGGFAAAQKEFLEVRPLDDKRREYTAHYAVRY